MTPAEASRSALLALLLAAPAAAEDYELPPPPAAGSHVEYQADKAEFDGAKSTLHLTGHVTVKQSTVTIKGDDLWIDDASRTGRADKPILVEDGVSGLYGESGKFDFAHQTGRLTRVSAGMGNWRLYAREGRLLEERRTKYRSADYTSCDREPPDYHFHSTSLSIVPKKYMLGWNTVFYLGPAPIFYTPVFYHSLDPDPMLKWRFQPGTDSRNGPYVKGTGTIRFSTTTYSKIYDDYYSNLGFGLGAELDHNSGTDSNGSLFGYRIHEDQTVRNRWGFFGSDYQKLTPSLAFQGRLQLQSDATFNNDYMRSDLFRLTPQLVNSAALTQAIPQGSLRLSYARVDRQDPATDKYVKQTEDLPRVDFNSNSFRLYKLPWLNTIAASAIDNYTVGRGFQQKSVNAGWTATRSFNLAKGVTYTPGLNANETFYNEFDETNYASSVKSTNLYSTVGRWSASNNLRFATLLGHVDVTHVYARRLKPDGLTEDTGPADKGVEANQVSVSDVFVPTPRTWGRVATSYDYRTFWDHAPSFAQRIAPITADMSWQPKTKLIFTLHNAYAIKDAAGNGGEQSFIADARWGDPRKGPSLGGGLSYNLTSPASYYPTVEFALAPSSPTWRVAVALRTVVTSTGGFGRARSGHLFEKEVSWSQTWHDFHTKVILRTRPGGVGEVTGQVEFRFGSTDPKTAPRRDWEAKWYPGRAKEDELR